MHNSITCSLQVCKTLEAEQAIGEETYEGVVPQVSAVWIIKRNLMEIIEADADTMQLTLNSGKTNISLLYNRSFHVLQHIVISS